MPSDQDPFVDHDHAHCAGHGLAQAEELLATRAARLTPVRRRTLEILLAEHRAIGAYDVLQRLAAEGFGHQPPVAYRALEFLVEQGLAHRVQRLNAFTACTHPGQDHAPVFLICQRCNLVAETPASPVLEALTKVAGAFRVERTTIEAPGLCPACAEDAPC